VIVTDEFCLRQFGCTDATIEALSEKRARALVRTAACNGTLIGALQQVRLESLFTSLLGERIETATRAPHLTGGRMLVGVYDGPPVRAGRVDLPDGGQVSWYLLDAT
jgi:hypothetical protein